MVQHTAGMSYRKSKVHPLYVSVFTDTDTALFTAQTEWAQSWVFFNMTIFQPWQWHYVRVNEQLVLDAIKSQGPVAVKCVNHRQRASVLHFTSPTHWGALSIHSTVAPTQCFSNGERKRRTDREREREKGRESIPLSFSQEEKKKEALTLNEQKEAGDIAPVHFTYTSI